MVDLEIELDPIPGILEKAYAYQPEEFIGLNDDLSTQTLSALKSLYDYTKTEENSHPSGTVLNKSLSLKKKSKKHSRFSKTEEPLKQLITEDFDFHQVWEEVQLQNALTYEHLVSSISQLLAVSRIAEKRRPDVGRDDLIEAEIEDDHEELVGSEEDEESDNGSHNPEEELDDEEDGSEEYDNDLVEDEEDEDEKEQSGSKTTKMLPSGSESSEEEEDERKLSNFEKRRKRIEENIKAMEESALEPKSWKYQGEITAEKRPENSLLEEHLLFDHLLKQAPEITATTTLKLEDIIKNRIKDGAWDDVIRKAKPVDNPNEYKRALVMNQEKSKLSLAQIYEQEYIENQKKADDQSTASSWAGGAFGSGADESNNVPEEELKIQKDLKSLFSKLDALSNFHFTPKPPSAEIKIVTNIPSINMEEVAPISVSDATMLAPQEIQDPEKGEIKSKSERDTTDKLRERRLKKKKQHLKRLAREEKARDSGIGLRNVKVAENILKKSKSKSKKNQGDDFNSSAAIGKELKSSKAFFNKLQEETQTLIKDTLGKRKNQNKKGNEVLSAKKFKL